jgi:hypothetical protein
MMSRQMRNSKLGLNGGIYWNAREFVQIPTFDGTMRHKFGREFGYRTNPDLVLRALGYKDES